MVFLVWVKLDTSILTWTRCAHPFLAEFWLSRSMQRGLCQAFVTHDCPLRSPSEMTKISACFSEDCEVENAIPWNLNFWKNAAVEMEDILWLLEQLAENYSNRKSDTRKLHLWPMKNRMLTRNFSPNFALFMTEMHHHIVICGRHGKDALLSRQGLEDFSDCHGPCPVGAKSFR